MTASDIRKDTVSDAIAFLCEIAAQLAELNERLEALIDRDHGTPRGYLRVTGAVSTSSE